MAQLSSLAKKITQQNRREVVTAVCKISRNLGKERQSVGQGCLVQTKQSNECCVVTADKVIPDGQLDTYEVEFTKKDSKSKRFCLKGITKAIKHVGELVIIVIDLTSPELKRGKSAHSIFTKSRLTITALEESKKQFCLIDGKCYHLQVINSSTIKFRDDAPSTIPDGLVILQTSNSTDHNVIAVGIQSQVDGNQKMTILNYEILAGYGSSQGNQYPSASLTTTAPDPDGGDQQLVTTAAAAAAAHKPGNEPQNHVVNNGTAVDDNTDDSHTSSTSNEDSADSAVHAVGGADHNFQSTKGAYKPETDQDEAALGHKMLPVGGNEQEVLQVEDNQAAPITAPEPPNPGTASNQTPANGDGQQSFAGAAGAAAAAADRPDNEPQNPVPNSGTAVSHTSSTNNEDPVDYPAPATGDADHNPHINSGSPEDGNSPTNHPIQEGSEDNATGGASDQQDGTVTENFEHYLVSDKIRGNGDLQNMLASHLDHTSHRMIKNWEDLASTKVIGAPLEVRLKCKLNGRNSCTQMLFELLVSDVKYKDKKVRDLINALNEIHNKAKTLIEGSPAYQEDAENFLNKEISEFADDELINSMATYLDQMSMYDRKPFWRPLGSKLGVRRQKLEEIQHCQVNSTKAVMDYHYSKTPCGTIGQFCDMVETKLERNDVLKIVKPIAERNRGRKMEEVVGLESDEMRAICVLLNKPISGVKNWKNLANELGIPRDIYKDFSPDHPESPTKILFDWIFNEKENLTVGQLISALRSIERNDVVEKLRQHFLQHSTTD